MYICVWSGSLVCVSMVLLRLPAHEMTACANQMSLFGHQTLKNGSNNDGPHTPAAKSTNTDTTPPVPISDTINPLVNKSALNCSIQISLLDKNPLQTVHRQLQYQYNIETS